MKNIIFIFFSLMSINTYAQIGVNTTSPKATLDIEALPNDLGVTDGIIAPRLTGNQLSNLQNSYTSVHEGTIVYATKPADAPAGLTINVKKEGYYYFDGSKWIDFVNNGNIVDTNDLNTNIYNTSSSLTGDRVVNLNGKKLDFITNSAFNNRFYISNKNKSSAVVMNLNVNKMAINSSLVNDAILTVNGAVGDKILKLTNIDNSITSSKYTNLTNGYFNEKKVTPLVIDESGDVLRQYTPTESSDFPQAYTVTTKLTDTESGAIVFNDITDASLCYFKMLFMPNNYGTYTFGAVYGEITFTVKDGFKIINQTTGDHLSNAGIFYIGGNDIYRIFFRVNNISSTLEYSNGSITFDRSSSANFALYIYDGFKI